MHICILHYFPIQEWKILWQPSNPTLSFHSFLLRLIQRRIKKRCQDVCMQYILKEQINHTLKANILNSLAIYTADKSEINWFVLKDQTLFSGFKNELLCGYSRKQYTIINSFTQLYFPGTMVPWSKPRKWWSFLRRCQQVRWVPTHPSIPSNFPTSDMNPKSQDYADFQSHRTMSRFPSFWRVLLFFPFFWRFAMLL